MSNSHLTSKNGDRTATADFKIPNVGQLSIEVESALPGNGSRHTAAERKSLAIRHARLLIRNLANQLDPEAQANTNV
jgi:hypothetical protein